MQALQDRSTFRADLVRVRHQPGYGSIDRDIDARAALLIETGPVERGLANADIALAHEALVADVHIIAVDSALYAESGAVLSFIARRHVAAELLRPFPQRRRDGCCKRASAAAARPNRCVGVM